MTKEETWSGLREFRRAGHYFELLEVAAGVEVDVTVYGKNDRVLYAGSGLTAGFVVDRRGVEPFERVEITTPSSTAVKFTITDGFAGQKAAPTNATITSPLLSDDADTQLPAGAALVGTVARLQIFDGANWDRITSQSTNADGLVAQQASSSTALRAAAYGLAFNGTTWDRLRADNVGGVGALRVTQRGITYGVAYKNNAVIGVANTATQILAPASNANGVIVWGGSGFSRLAGLSYAHFVAHTASPTAFSQGQGLGEIDLDENGADVWSRCRIEQPTFVPSGLGLYWFSAAIESVAAQLLRYTVL